LGGSIGIVAQGAQKLAAIDLDLYLPKPACRTGCAKGGSGSARARMVGFG
jgi:hypothetical protein